jgi:hypothetical protein
MNKKSKAFWAEVGRAVPGLERVAGEIAGQTVEHLLGFWVLWHTSGGLEPMIAQKVISRSSVYSQRSQFHRIMHVEVEHFWPEAVAFMASERARLLAESAAP